MSTTGNISAPRILLSVVAVSPDSAENIIQDALAQGKIVDNLPAFAEPGNHLLAIRITDDAANPFQRAIPETRFNEIGQLNIHL